MFEQLPADTTSAVSDLGGTGLLAVVAWHAVKFLAHVTRFLDKVETHLEVQRDHQKNEAAAWGRVAEHLHAEEAHQERVERLLAPAAVVHVPIPAAQPGNAKDTPERGERRFAIESG